jgi:hypothetical protein
MWIVTARLGNDPRPYLMFETNDFTEARRYAAYANLRVYKLRNRIGQANRRMRDEGQRLTLPTEIYRAFTVIERIVIF